jgi:hypothetical protein
MLLPGHGDIMIREVVLINVNAMNRSGGKPNWSDRREERA